MFSFDLVRCRGVRLVRFRVFIRVFAGVGRGEYVGGEVEGGGGKGLYIFS